MPEETQQDQSSVSVVIPALNVEATLTDQLEALTAQNCDCLLEVIVADNGSTDKTPTIVQAFADADARFKIVDASTAPGINHARNTGARAARGDFILFCDGDDIVDIGWVKAMRNTLLDHDGAAGSVEHRRLNGEGHLGVHLQPRVQAPAFLPSPLGANCGVRSTVWRELGGFDETFVGGAADEIEFFWRLQLCGYSLGVAPRAIVHYRLPKSSKVINRKAYRAGREGARLHRKFRTAGHQRRPIPTAMRSLLSLLLRAPIALVSRRQRESWGPMAARQAGRLVGSARFRTIYP